MAGILNVDQRSARRANRDWKKYHGGVSLSLAGVTTPTEASGERLNLALLTLVPVEKGLPVRESVGIPPPGEPARELDTEVGSSDPTAICPALLLRGDF